MTSLEEVATEDCALEASEEDAFGDAQEHRRRGSKNKKRFFIGFISLAKYSTRVNKRGCARAYAYIVWKNYPKNETN